jgi:hypothetical protein
MGDGSDCRSTIDWTFLDSSGHFKLTTSTSVATSPFIHFFTDALDSPFPGKYFIPTMSEGIRTTKSSEWRTLRGSELAKSRKSSLGPPIWAQKTTSSIPTGRREPRLELDGTRRKTDMEKRKDQDEVNRKFRFTTSQVGSSIDDIKRTLAELDFGTNSIHTLTFMFTRSPSRSRSEEGESADKTFKLCRQ